VTCTISASAALTRPERPLNCTSSYWAWYSAGIRVIVNLRRSYSHDFPGGQGTVPPSDKWGRFIAGAIQTIRDARGVYAFTLFNEADNPREWPVEGHQLTADHVVYLYNAIYREVKDLPVKVGLGALDPFYGPGSNCMDWWEHILAEAIGAEVYITEYNHLWLEDELFPQNPTINVHRGPYRTLLRNARRWGSLNLLRWFTVPRWGRPEQARASRAPE
jgi:hypothetical protein